MEIWTTARLDPAFFAIQLIEPPSGVKWINGTLVRRMTPSSSKYRWIALAARANIMAL